MAYAEALELQKDLVRRRRAGEIPDTFLLLEHSPVYTLGKRAKKEHLLADEQTLRRLNAEVVATNRGGEITFHGPGQIVGYPIVDLNALRCDVKWYLERLEEVMIRTVGEFGVSAGRVECMRGTWVGQRKIGAIGVRIERWVTYHGFALNVATDLEYFRHIVPCGIPDRGVTSLSAELGREVSIEEVRPHVIESFEKVFRRKIVYEETVPQT